MNRRLLLWISCCAMTVAGLALRAGASFGMLSRKEPLGATLMLSFINLLFFGAVALAVWCGSGSSARFVEWRILKFYGDISYGLYLYHLLIFTLFDWTLWRIWPHARETLSVSEWLFLRLTVVSILASGLAYISRWKFEERFLKLRLNSSGRAA